MGNKKEDNILDDIRDTANKNIIKERKQRKLAMECIIANPKYLSIIKNKLIDDDLLEYILDLEPDVFTSIKNPSIRIIDVALEKDGANLGKLKSDDLKRLTASSYLIALKSNPIGALQYLPHNFKIPDDMVVELFKENPEMFIDKDILFNETYLTPVILDHPQYIKFVSNPSETLRCIAIRSNPNTALYFNELTPKMMDVIDEAWPQYRSMLPNYTREIIKVEELDNGTNEIDQSESENSGN